MTAGTLGNRLGIVPVIAAQGIGYCAAGVLVLTLVPPQPLPSQDSTDVEERRHPVGGDMDQRRPRERARP